MSERKRYETARESEARLGRGDEIYQLHTLVEIARQLGTDEELKDARVRVVRMIDSLTYEMSPDESVLADDRSPDQDE